MVELAGLLTATGAFRETIRRASSFTERCGALHELLPDVYRAKAGVSDFDGAAKVAAELVALDPVTPDAWVWRGDAYEHLGNLEGALDDYRQALLLFSDPSRVAASEYYRVARVLAALDRPCEALASMKTYLSFDPSRRQTQQIASITADWNAKGNCVHLAGVAELPVQRKGGVLIVPAVVNGQQGRFVVDTGASVVALTQQFATRAAVDTNFAKPIQLMTANGMVSAKSARLTEVRVDKAVARNVFAVVQNAHAEGFGAGVDGLLGLSFLGNFRVTVAHDRLKLE